MMFLPSRLPFTMPERSLFCPTCRVMFYRDPTTLVLLRRCVFSTDPICSGTGIMPSNWFSGSTPHRHMAMFAVRATICFMRVWNRSTRVMVRTYFCNTHIIANLWTVFHKSNSHVFVLLIAAQLWLMTCIREDCSPLVLCRNTVSACKSPLVYSNLSDQNIDHQYILSCSKCLLTARQMMAS